MDFPNCNIIRAGIFCRLCAVFILSYFGGKVYFGLILFIAVSLGVETGKETVAFIFILFGTPLRMICP